MLWQIIVFFCMAIKAFTPRHGGSTHGLSQLRVWIVPVVHVPLASISPAAGQCAGPARGQASGALCSHVYSEVP